MHHQSEKFLVVANGEPPSPQLLQQLFKNHTQLIAVDGGLFTCLEYGLQPQLLIGDFDSVSEKEREQFSFIPQKHTPDQNQSDLEKTLEYLLTLSPEAITVCGALGRRMDQTLTNICLLSRYPGKVKFETDHETCFALLKSNTLACQVGQTLSLIPLSTQVLGVTTQGLKWELKEATLSKHFLSISNLCLQQDIFISFSSGDLVVCLNRNS